MRRVTRWCLIAITSGLASHASFAQRSAAEMSITAPLDSQYAAALTALHDKVGALARTFVDAEGPFERQQAAEGTGRSNDWRPGLLFLGLRARAHAAAARLVSLFMDVSDLVRREVRARFASSDVADVERLLEATSLPFLDAADRRRERDRVHLAMLKQAGGDFEQFARCLALAATDWRDVLVGAGLADENWPKCSRPLDSRSSETSPADRAQTVV